MNLVYRGRSYQKQSISQPNSKKFSAFAKYRGISYRIPSNMMLQQSLSVLKYRGIEYISKANHSEDREQPVSQICCEAENAG